MVDKLKGECSVHYEIFFTIFLRWNLRVTGVVNSHYDENSLLVSFNFNVNFQPSYVVQLRINRPLVAPTTPSSAAYGPRHRQRRACLLLLAACGTLVLLVGSSYLYFGPSAGVTIPDHLPPYYAHPMFPGAHGGNTPPPAHGSAHEEHPHPGAPPGGRPSPIDGPDAVPPPNSDSSSSPDDATSAHLPALLSSQPATLPAARALHSKDLQHPSKRVRRVLRLCKGARMSGGRVCGGVARFCAVLEAREAANGGRLEGKGGRGWFRERVEAVEKRLASDSDTHGIAAFAIRDGRAHKPEHQAAYFDGDSEGTVNKFASALPPMTVLINGRDEPRVVFDVGLLFEGPPTLAQALTLSDPTPFTLSPPRTGAFFAQPERKDVCRPRGRGGECFFMTKLSDASTSLSGGDNSPAGGSCFADVLVPGEIGDMEIGVGFDRWAGQFEYPDNVKWEDKKEVLYPFCLASLAASPQYQLHAHSFPHFRLMDLAALPENRAKDLFDVRIMQWHEWHCTERDFVG
ncbi:hypothetical protein B0H13DRAFT_1880422 [Mycena leptocephala]|nr:hypothetical protein B0H13DRAFT_1880422 [Mycena leptocephala]